MYVYKAQITTTIEVNVIKWEPGYVRHKKKSFTYQNDSCKQRRVKLINIKNMQVQIESI